MFKKERDLAERSKTLLKNKEVRSLKSDIVKKFPNISEEELNAVIPNKANISITKLANKTLLYSLDGVTLLFDIEGRNNLCPALPFLWRFPNALPSFVIHSPVSEFVLRGADLMIPGICKSKLSDLQACDLKEGQKASIRVTGNPLPFAVGDSLVSGSALCSGKLKGRAVTVLHVYGDMIATSGVVPNSGFGPSRIYALEGYVEPGTVGGEDEYSGDEEDEEEEEGEENGANDFNSEKHGEDKLEGEGKEGDTVSAVSGVTGGVAALDLQSSDPQLESERIEGGEDEGVCEDDDEVPEGEEEGDATEVKRLSAPEHDALLLQAVLLASKYVVKDKQLPMLVSTYWALLQRCAITAGIGRLDIKRSSYRKVTPFLVHCCRDLDLMDFKEDSGVATVTKLNKTHDLFRGVKVENPEQFKTAVLNTNATASISSPTPAPAGEFAQFSVSGNNNSGVGSGGGGKNSSKVQVLELFKLTKHLRDVFGTPKGVYGEYLHAGEVKDVLSLYIRSHALEDADNKSSLIVPPSDPVHKLLASYSSVNVTKSVPKAALPSNPIPKMSSDASYPAESDNMYLYEDNDTEGYDDGEGQAKVESTLCSQSALSSILGESSGANIKMKINSAGLRSVDDPSWPLPSTSASSGASSASVSASASARIGGCSSVGGWGVDKGAVWKPVSLSTARATAAAEEEEEERRKQGDGSNSKRSGKSKNSAGTSLDMEFPALGSAVVGKKSSIKGTSGKNSSGSVVVYSELPSDLHMRKEEVYKAMMKKMSPYFGVINHTGALSVHSGQVPKARVLVESRMGNKAVTILRGLEVFGLDLTGLTKDCQKKFACSCALSSVPGIPKDKEIVIQGNLAFEVEAYLVGTCGLPKGLIEIDATKGAKLKKRK